jgi:hypothetical protein
MTSKRHRPVVLAIDDDELTGTELSLRASAEVVTRLPDEVTVGDLRRANVVLIDYQIDDWPGRDNTVAITLKPANGVALAAVLRSQAEGRSGRTWNTRRAFAIHSGKLHELAGGLPAPSREHAIARTLNLEWAFSKAHSTHNPPLRVQVESLARAVKRLPVKWPEEPEKAVAAVQRLLSAPSSKERWRERAFDDVAACQPPVHAWANATKGMAVIRWLLHQVLPYPTFLWDERYLAARLHVTADSLRKALSAQKKTQRAFAESEYSGVLDAFLGKRWWRAGIEHLLWQWTDGNPFNGAALQKAVRTRVSKSLDAVDLSRPVVCVDDRSFRPTDHFVDAANAVEVKPDDWPSFAEQPWLPAATKGTEKVSALVVAQDRERAGGSGE